MTQYKVSAGFVKVLEDVESVNYKPGDLLSHTELIGIHKTHKKTKSLLELVRLTTLYIPKPEKEESPKTKEYVKLMAKLRLEEKEKEFRTLTQPKMEYTTLYEENGEETKTLSQMNKELKNDLTTIVNILISVASVVYAIWYWTATSWSLPMSYRVLLCVFFGILVLVAEVVVYMGYLNKIEEARVKERSKKEIKKVVKIL